MDSSNMTPLHDQSIVSEGQAADIKELETIIKTQFNEDALNQALKEDDEDD